MKPTPILFCDIDGTIRMGYDELGYFVNTPDQVKVFPEVPALLQGYKYFLNWRIVGVSNQGGIALGHMSEEICDEAMKETNRQCCKRFDSIVWCPHHPASDDPVLGVECWCRKPRIGMITGAARDLARINNEFYAANNCVFVGDRPEDEECAKNAGMDFLWAKDWRKGDHLNLMLALGIGR